MGSEASRAQQRCRVSMTPVLAPLRDFARLMRALHDVQGGPRYRRQFRKVWNIAISRVLCNQFSNSRIVVRRKVLSGAVGPVLGWVGIDQEHDLVFKAAQFGMPAVSLFDLCKIVTGILHTRFPQTDDSRIDLDEIPGAKHFEPKRKVGARSLVHGVGHEQTRIEVLATLARGPRSRGV